MAALRFPYKMSDQHCPVQPGDVLKSSRYQILRRLGIGVNSVVWLARDQEQNRYVALKIAKSRLILPGGERRILEHLRTESPSHPGKAHVLPLLDSFNHRARTGMHECLVFQVMGPSFGEFVWAFKLGTAKPDSHGKISPGTAKIQLSVLKSMLRQVLLGLDFLHKRGIVHNDLHPGNILISIKGLHSIDGGQWTLSSARSSSADQDSQQSTLPRAAAPSAKRLKISHTAVVKNFPRGNKHSPATGGKYNKTSNKNYQPGHFSPPQPLNILFTLVNPVIIKISDMGGAFFVANPPAKPATPTNLRSPEVIVGHPITEGQDIWSFGCLIFELIARRALFKVKSYEYNTSGAENNAAQNAGVAENAGEATTKMKTDSTQTPPLPGLNTSYLQQFACRLGPLPSSILSKYPKAFAFFEKDGTAKAKDGSPPWTSLEAHFDQGEAFVDLNDAEKVAVFDVIRYILRYEPEKRPTTRQLLRHPWFLDISA